MPPDLPRRKRGSVLLMVLVFSALVTLMAAAALVSGALDTRIAAERAAAARARNLADTALELLVRRTMVRWSTGGEHCAADRYCADDFPGVAAVRASVPDGWELVPSLQPLAAPVASRRGEATASGATRSRMRYLEARVAVGGKAPMDLAAGLALPAPAAVEAAP